MGEWTGSYHPRAEPLKKDNAVETKAQNNAVPNRPHWRWWRPAELSRGIGRVVADVISQFLYGSTYIGYENTFQRKIETPMQGFMASSRDVPALRSTEWLHLDDPNTEPLSKALTFLLLSFS